MIRHARCRFLLLPSMLILMMTVINVRMVMATAVTMIMMVVMKNYDDHDGGHGEFSQPSLLTTIQYTKEMNT